MTHDQTPMERQCLFIAICGGMALLAGITNIIQYGIPDHRISWALSESGAVRRFDRTFITNFAKIGQAVHRGVFRPRQTRQLPRAVDLKGRLLSCQSY